MISVCFVFIADSIIGIRSNYSANDQIGKPNTKSTTGPSSSTSAANLVGDGANVLKTQHPYVNQNPLLFDPPKSPQKKVPDSINVHAIDAAKTAPATLQVNNAPPTITVTPTADDADKTIDGMLDRISHDLDYLLNRTNEIPPAPPPPTSTVPAVLHSHPNLSVREVILEEEAEDS